MNVLKKIQKLLDGEFYERDIHSFHMRRQSDKTDAYIVFRLLPSNNSIYGDGKAIMYQYQFDFNLYYEKNDSIKMFDEAELLQKILLKNGFKLLNGISDLSDMDTDLRGFNISVSYSKKIDVNEH